MVLHVNAFWAEKAGKFTKVYKDEPFLDGEKGKFVSYQVTRNETGFIQVTMTRLMNLVLMEQKEKVTQLLRNSKDKDSKKKYEVKFDRAFAKNANDFLESAKIPLAEYEALPPVQQLYLRTGLKPKEQQEAIKKAVELTRVALAEFKPVVQKEEDFLSWVPFGQQVLKNYQVNNGSQVKDVQLPQTFTNLDIGSLSCVTFAFLYLNDQEFIRIWDGKVTPNFLGLGSHHEILMAMNYRAVPLPDAGDIVTYIHCGTKDTGAVLTHIGIVQENGRVLSKLGGVDDPHIYEHDLDKIPSNYGNIFRFYRKTA